jgi:hypothetical protein
MCLSGKNGWIFNSWYQHSAGPPTAAATIPLGAQPAGGQTSQQQVEQHQDTTTTTHTATAGVLTTCQHNHTQNDKLQGANETTYTCVAVLLPDGSLSW